MSGVTRARWEQWEGTASKDQSTVNRGGVGSTEGNMVARVTSEGGRWRRRFARLDPLRARAHRIR